MAANKLTPEERKEKRKAQARARYLVNADARRAKSRAFRAENPELIRERRVEYDARYLEKGGRLRANEERRKQYWENHEKEIARNREKGRRARSQHREMLLERTRKWRAENREKLREYGRSEKERQRAREKKFTEHGRIAIQNGVRNRRARKRAAIGSHTTADIVYLHSAQNEKCAACEVTFTKTGEGKCHVDHVIPLSRGGSNWPENLQLLCASCNIRKNNRLPDEWARLLLTANKQRPIG